MLRALVVDDEKPARDDLVWLLQKEDRIGQVEEAPGGSAALKLLSSVDQESPFDVVFLDMAMPDLNGLDIARMISRFEDPPAIVFVTAFDTPASDAFELGVVDYLRKPVAGDRLSRAVSRVCAASGATTHPLDVDVQTARLAVATPAGNQLLLSPGDVTHFESCGDYVRVHTDEGSYLVRDTMARLTDGWARHGFVRTHRSFAVRMSAVNEMRSGPQGRSVCVGSVEVPVSRRYARELTMRLIGDSGDLSS